MLIAKPASTPLDTPGLVFNVIVDGQDPAVAAERAQVQRSAWVEKREQARREAAVKRIRDTALAASITHCHYMAQGQHVSFEPKCPLTNGQWVWFRFLGQVKKPSIEVVDADLKTTRVPRQHAVGDFVVVEEYAQRFRLIMGQEVLDVFDTDFNAVGSEPGTGTISPAVDRELIQAGK
jgi:type IV secretion system protein VirB9